MFRVVIGIMQPVIQEDKSGCGFASVATLAGVTYKQVKRVAGQLGIEIQGLQLWSETKYVRQLLTHYGLSTSPYTRPFKSWNSLPPLALLAIKWHKRNSCAFWQGPEGPVTLDPKQFLQNNVRTDFGRIKPKWFIPIVSKRSL